MVEFGILALIILVSLLLAGILLKKHAAEYVVPLCQKTPAKTKRITPIKSSDRFLQTMGATFAHLQIGIAVFDTQNELSLFNPALSQHLGLRPEWLLKNPIYLGFWIN